MSRSPRTGARGDHRRTVRRGQRAALGAARATAGRVERAGEFHAARGWLGTTAGTVLCACLHYRFGPFSVVDDGR